jgi:hypothetical protein
VEAAVEDAVEDVVGAAIKVHILLVSKKQYKTIGYSEDKRVKNTEHTQLRPILPC